VVGTYLTWLRRHWLAAFVSIAATVMLAGGYALVWAVQKARTAVGTTNGCN
jgi:hypothetical protein